ncbi:MAG: hypothetical protein AB1416_12320, partial [Actinomycetota bacterium]
MATTRRMRIGVGVAAGTAVLVAAAPAAAKSVPVACPGASQLTVLFWPKGHPKIASLGFPAYRLPHAELFAAAKQVAYLEAGGAKGPVGSTSGCRKVTGAVTSPTVPSATRVAK